MRRWHRQRLAGLGADPLAARVWGAVEAEERALSFRMLADERQRYERWANTTREHLGDPAFLAACTDGEALPIDEALSQALDLAAPADLGRPNPADGPPEVSSLSDDDARFEREGEYWSISFATRTSRLRDSKGLRVLAHLLADAGRSHAALDLERLGAPGGQETARAVASGDAGEMLDAEARRAYWARVAELREAIERAEAWGNANEVGLLREEMDFINHELSRALGLGGRSRHAGSIAERARLNVMRAVRSAMQRIASADAKLGAHLEATVHTGTVCVYTPDPRVDIAWRVTIGGASYLSLGGTGGVIANGVVYAGSVAGATQTATATAVVLADGSITITFSNLADSNDPSRTVPGTAVYACKTF